MATKLSTKHTYIRNSFLFQSLLKKKKTKNSKTQSCICRTAGILIGYGSCFKKHGSDSKLEADLLRTLKRQRRTSQDVK